VDAGIDDEVADVVAAVALRRRAGAARAAGDGAEARGQLAAGDGLDEHAVGAGFEAADNQVLVVCRTDDDSGDAGELAQRSGEPAVDPALGAENGEIGRLACDCAVGALDDETRLCELPPKPPIPRCCALEQ
jgi:hypothetical protein